MRLICPHCQQPVTLPESAAGIPTPCPTCGQTITPPALTGAAMDAAPDPVIVPPPPSRVASESPASRVASAPGVVAPPTPGADATRLARTGAPWFHLTLRRNVAHWIAPGALLIAFVLTFFTWVAAAPNGTRIYTQNCWSAASGSKVNADAAGERVMHAETDLNAHMRASAWLVFYLIVLIPTTAIAIADRVLARKSATIPDILKGIWPHRQTIVAGLCALLLILLILPAMAGFGLQNAVKASVAQALPEPPNATTAEIADRELAYDVGVARFGLERTIWLKLAIAAQIIALIGIGTANWLDRHPNAPDPRLEIYC